MSHEASIYDLDLAGDEDHFTEWMGRSPTGEFVELTEPDLEFRCQVGIRRAKKAVPSWRPFLRDLGIDLRAESDNDSESVVIAIRITDVTTDDARWILFCFGGVSRSVPTELLDSRFGIITALNKQTADSGLEPWRTLPNHARRRRLNGDPKARVRNVSAEVRDGYKHRMVANSGAASPLHGLRFDTVTDLLRGLSVRTEDELMRDLSGDKSLKFATYLESMDDFEQLAEYLFALRNRSDYQDEWQWIDNIIPVPAKAEADELLRRLASRIGQDDEPDIELVMPEWDSLNESPSRRLLVALPGERLPPVHVLLTWDQLRSWLLRRRPYDEQKLPILRSEIRAAQEGTASGGVERFQLCDLIVTEFEEDGRQYVLSDGEVYRVEGGYLDRLDDMLSTIEWSTYPFPAYTGGNEPDYLQTVRTDHPDRLAVLDRKNIYLPHQTAFEPCDVVTDRGDLVFVKMKGRSATFSHLCTQAVASADILFRERSSHTLLVDELTSVTNNDKIHDAVMNRLSDLENGRPGSLTLCLLLLGTWRGEPDIRKLPLVSRLILYKTFQRISAYGFRLELASPPPSRDRLTSQ